MTDRQGEPPGACGTGGQDNRASEDSTTAAASIADMALAVNRPSVPPAPDRQEATAALAAAILSYCKPEIAVVILEDLLTHLRKRKP